MGRGFRYARWRAPKKVVWAKTAEFETLSYLRRWPFDHALASARAQGQNRKVSKKVRRHSRSRSEHSRNMRGPAATVSRCRPRARQPAPICQGRPQIPPADTNRQVGRSRRHRLQRRPRPPDILSANSLRGFDAAALLQDAARGSRGLRPVSRHPGTTAAVERTCPQSFCEKVWMPHSSFWPPHLPDRGLLGSLGIVVHGSQPMLV